MSWERDLQQECLEELTDIYMYLCRSRIPDGLTPGGAGGDRNTTVIYCCSDVTPPSSRGGGGDSNGR